MPRSRSRNGCASQRPATNLHTRHPLLLASLCTSLHYLSGGRFELGLARGIGVRNSMMGLEGVTNAKIAEGLELLRTLWRGEKVVGHDGALGTFPYLSSGDWIDATIPIHFVGFGPKSIRMAGAHFDGVHLHTFLSHEGLRRAKALVQEGAEEAGRDPDAVKITTVCATAVEPSREDHLRKFVARMATYMQAPNYVELLCELNGWDREVLTAFRASPVVQSMAGGIDSVATLEQLEQIAELIPAEWFAAAVGKPRGVRALLAARAGERCGLGVHPRLDRRGGRTGPRRLRGADRAQLASLRKKKGARAEARAPCTSRQSASSPCG